MSRGLVPHERIQFANEASVQPQGDFVLYWMIAARRTRFHFGLARAIELAKQFRKPLVVLEALRCGYPWASDRLHQFVADGMIDNQRRFAATDVTYYPYIEPKAGAGQGLVEAFAANAIVIVTDDFPCFFLPKMVASLAKRVHVSVELVDSNGLFPMRSTERIFSRAFSFRRFLQEKLPQHLTQTPVADPLASLRLPRYEVPREIARAWPVAQLAACNESGWLQDLPIDHQVRPAQIRGGAQQAANVLQHFVSNRLGRYLERSHPDDDTGSGLSPYLHFGHISAHEVFAAVASAESWSFDKLSPTINGSAGEWWGMSEAGESFMDELVTWRELGFNLCSHSSDYDQYDSLPDWAQTTLQEHSQDKRAYVYTLSQFEFNQTHDRLWNAAQRQLVAEGKMHNYLRMLWGKKILEWSASPQEALSIMLELNNRYAIDGRDPNSYSGIFWVLGRYDRAWGPERPIFGKIRYMSSENTIRKVRLREYLAKYGPD